ncbi:MAG: SAM-dependent methyltransferase [Bacteroidia bacterium]|jgi:SAM-dependent methyltransferase
MLKKLITSLLSYAIGIAKRSRYIQNVFESPFDLSKYPKKGTFVDSHGDSHNLLEGLRSKIRPGWQRMLVQQKTEVTPEYLERQKTYGELALKKILPIIEALGKSVVGSKVLEVGCHSGGTSFAIAEYGAAEVVGTEFSGYKVKAVDSAEGKYDNRLIEVNEDLLQIRTKLASLFKLKNKVKFVDDDICNSTLPPKSFDIICSWEVLEHVHDAEGAFSSMSRLLNDGGLAIHEYNPFFSLNGGHSLCTLDTLWGHTRLSTSDFEKYLDQLRPQEKNKALAFFKAGLNRMTLYDLRTHLEKAKLEIVSIVPFTKEQHLNMINDKILSQTQRNYPNATLLDLCAPRVYVVARKKMEG